MAAAGAQALRRRLVAELRAKGVLTSEAAAGAFLAVPRERFIAGAADLGLEAVYRDEAILIKTDVSGRPLSSSSQPGLMAKMLELLDVRPGQRVLEIGAGTGYNSALLSHLVGDRGRVVTVDVDGQVARDARRHLREAGYRAAVKIGDGRRGLPELAPYDRIIVTAAAGDIAAAWIDQLVERGRLVVPLRLDADAAAIQLIPVLERRGERLHGFDMTWGSFMPLHGGDGGWSAPPAALSASHTAGARARSLTSLSGRAVGRLSRDRAEALLAALLSGSERPRRQGTIDLTSSRPPLLLLHLLLAIPPSRRVAANHEQQIGIGIIERRGAGLALVTIRNPWRDAGERRSRRARWRLDAFGDGERAAAELERLIDEWEEFRRAGRTCLAMTAEGRPPRIRFAWTSRTAPVSGAGSGGAGSGGVGRGGVGRGGAGRGGAGRGGAGPRA